MTAYFATKIPYLEILSISYESDFEVKKKFVKSSTIPHVFLCAPSVFWKYGSTYNEVSEIICHSIEKTSRPLHVGSKTQWSVLCGPKKVTRTNVAVAKSIHHKVLLLPFWISAKNSPTLWHFGEEGHLSNYAKKGSNPKRGIRSIKSWKTS